MALHQTFQKALQFRESVGDGVGEGHLIIRVSELILERQLEITLPLRVLIAYAWYEPRLAQFRELVNNVLASFDPPLVFQLGPILLGSFPLQVPLRVDRDPQPLMVEARILREVDYVEFYFLIRLLEVLI